jgi:hypothetical protein
MKGKKTKTVLSSLFPKWTPKFLYRKKKTKNLKKVSNSQSNPTGIFHEV